MSAARAGAAASTDGLRHAHIAHHIPGRMRLVIQEARRDVGFLLDAAERIRQLAAVLEVDPNPATGSLVVLYEGDGSELAAAVAEVGIREGLYMLAPQIERLARAVSMELGVSQAARTVLALARAADRELSRATGGWLDLRALLPLGAAGASFVGRRRGPTPRWLTLAIFAFTSFEALHRNPPTSRNAASHSRADHRRAGRGAARRGAAARGTAGRSHTA